MGFFSFAQYGKVKSTREHAGSDTLSPWYLHRFADATLDLDTNLNHNASRMRRASAAVGQRRPGPHALAELHLASYTFISCTCACRPAAACAPSLGELRMRPSVSAACGLRSPLSSRSAGAWEENVGRDVRSSAPVGTVDRATSEGRLCPAPDSARGGASAVATPGGVGEVGWLSLSLPTWLGLGLGFGFGLGAGLGLG